MIFLQFLIAGNPDQAILEANNAVQLAQNNLQTAQNISQVLQSVPGLRTSLHATQLHLLETQQQLARDSIEREFENAVTRAIANLLRQEIDTSNRIRNERSRAQATVATLTTERDQAIENLQQERRGFRSFTQDILSGSILSMHSLRRQVAQNQQPLQGGIQDEYIPNLLLHRDSTRQDRNRNPNLSLPLLAQYLNLNNGDITEDLSNNTVGYWTIILRGNPNIGVLSNRLDDVLTLQRIR